MKISSKNSLLKQLAPESRLLDFFETNLLEKLIGPTLSVLMSLDKSPQKFILILSINLSLG